jgi:Fur family peroxide stress response transcriptional regulator
MHPRSDALTELEARCAAAGIPLTSQRRAVLEAVAARSDHPTVDQIYAAVAQRLPDISRATVYRSLETLVGLGLLKRVEHPGSTVRFDAKTGPHHHFLCTVCGAITDLPLEAVEGHESLAFRGPEALVAQELAILVRGTCGCAASNGGLSASRAGPA